MKKIIGIIKNNEGAFLIESLIGLAVMTIVLVGFTSIITSSSKLSQEAFFERQVTEQIFSRFENGQLPSPTPGASAFQVNVDWQPISRDDIIMSNDKKLSEVAPGSDIVIGLPGSPIKTRILENVKFFQYEDQLDGHPNYRVSLYKLGH